MKDSLKRSGAELCRGVIWCRQGRPKIWCSALICCREEQSRTEQRGDLVQCFDLVQSRTKGDLEKVEQRSGAEQRGDLVQAAMSPFCPRLNYSLSRPTACATFQIINKNYRATHFTQEQDG